MAAMHSEVPPSSHPSALSIVDLRPAQLTASLRVWLAGDRSPRGRNFHICVPEESALDGALQERIALILALYPGLRIVLEQAGKERVLERTDGLPGSLRERMGGTRGLLPSVARFSAELPAECGDVMSAEVAFQWLVEGTGSVLSVVNDAPTPGHGTPLLGFVAGLCRALEEEGLEQNLLHYGMPALTPKRVLRGVAAILRLEHPAPLYSSPSRSALSSRDAHTLFEQLAFNKIRALCKENSGLIQTLLSRALDIPIENTEVWSGRSRLGAVA